MAAAKLDPIVVEALPLRWHVGTRSRLQSLQSLCDKALGYPRPATDADGGPIPNAMIVEHYAGIETETGPDPRYRLRALPPEAFTDSPALTTSEVAEISEASAVELPINWKDGAE